MAHGGLVAGGEAAPTRDWLVGSRFFDEEEEYEVMRVARKRRKKSAIDVAFYCAPDERAGELEWEWHKVEEYGAYAHRCGAPPSSRPLSPCPCNAAVPKGPTFSFLNY